MPPGYRDSGKADGSGDFIIWAQAIQEAARRKAPLLFVTCDDKEDWFLKVKGRTICARPELVEEARHVSGIPAVIAQTQSLLLYARRHLQAPVSEETLRQAKAREQTQPRQHASSREQENTNFSNGIAVTPEELANSVRSLKSEIDDFRSRVRRNQGVLEEAEASMVAGHRDVSAKSLDKLRTEQQFDLNHLHNLQHARSMAKDTMTTDANGDGTLTVEGSSLLGRYILRRRRLVSESDE